jgi:uncharacterized protein YggE
MLDLAVTLGLKGIDSVEWEITQDDSEKAAAATSLLLLVQRLQTQTQRRDSYDQVVGAALGTRRTHGRFSGGPCSRL